MIGGPKLSKEIQEHPQVACNRHNSSANTMPLAVERPNCSDLATDKKESSQAKDEHQMLVQKQIPFFEQIKAQEKPVKLAHAQLQYNHTAGDLYSDLERLLKHCNVYHESYYKDYILCPGQDVTKVMNCLNDSLRHLELLDNMAIIHNTPLCTLPEDEECFAKWMKACAIIPDTDEFGMVKKVIAFTLDCYQKRKFKQLPRDIQDQINNPEAMSRACQQMVINQQSQIIKINNMAQNIVDEVFRQFGSNLEKGGSTQFSKKPILRFNPNEYQITKDPNFFL